MSLAFANKRDFFRFRFRFRNSEEINADIIRTSGSPELTFAKSFLTYPDCLSRTYSGGTVSRKDHFPGSSLRWGGSISRNRQFPRKFPDFPGTVPDFPEVSRISTGKSRRPNRFSGKPVTSPEKHQTELTRKQLLTQP